jgi:hypothetical protein
MSPEEVLLGLGEGIDALFGLDLSSLSPLIDSRSL